MAETALAAHPLDDESVPCTKYLTFVLGCESYGLDIKFVREIIRMQAVTSIPDTPGYIRGVINLRGRVIPVMDVRLRFSMSSRDDDDRTCIIVVQVGEWTVGLVVDTVSEVLDIASDQIEPPPRTLGNNNAHFIEGMGKLDDRVRLLLDARQLLDATETPEVVLDA